MTECCDHEHAEKLAVRRSATLEVVLAIGAATFLVMVAAAPYADMVSQAHEAVARKNHKESGWAALVGGFGCPHLGLLRVT